MTLPSPNMDDCCPKKRCINGANAGLIYEICDPCQGEKNSIFNEANCDCEQTYCKVNKLFEYQLQSSAGGSTSVKAIDEPTFEWTGSEWVADYIPCSEIPTSKSLGGSVGDSWSIASYTGAGDCATDCYYINVYTWFTAEGFTFTAGGSGPGSYGCEGKPETQDRGCLRKVALLGCNVTYEWVAIAEDATAQWSTGPTGDCQYANYETHGTQTYTRYYLVGTSHFENAPDELFYVRDIVTEEIIEYNTAYATDGPPPGGGSYQWLWGNGGREQIFRSDDGICGFGPWTWSQYDCTLITDVEDCPCAPTLA